MAIRIVPLSLLTKFTSILTIVLVNAIGVSAVMYPMVGRCVQNPFQWTKFIHYLCVDPELVEEV